MEKGVKSGCGKEKVIENGGSKTTGIDGDAESKTYERR